MHVPKPVSNQYQTKYGKGYEPGVVQILIKKLSPRKTFFDVGASYGIFSLLAKKIIGTPENIHAFEPNPYAYAVLKKNNTIYCNNKMNLVRKFISNTNSKNRITLDSYFKKTLCEPHLIKIDIEGGEIRAINGMIYLLKRVHPMLLMEVHPQFIKKLYGNPKLIIDKYIIEKLSKIGYMLDVNLSYELEYSIWQEIRYPETNFLPYRQNFYIFAY